MAEKKQPVFVNGLFVQEHVFQNGGSILKLGVNVDLLVEFLQANKKQNGWCNLLISKKRNPSEKSTHYATLDTYEKGDKPYVGRAENPPQNDSHRNPPTDPNGDDVPF